MAIVILGLVALAAVGYVFYNLSRYFATSGELNQRILDLQETVESKNVRLKEYEDRTEFLQEEVPRLEHRRGRLEGWTRLLQDQRGHLQAQNRPAANDPEARKKAIQQAARKRGV